MKKSKESDIDKSELCHILAISDDCLAIMHQRFQAQSVYCKLDVL
jgi:hypothetical protein